MNIWTEGRTDRLTNGHADRQTDVLMYVRTYVQAGRQKLELKTMLLHYRCNTMKFLFGN